MKRLFVATLLLFTAIFCFAQTTTTMPDTTQTTVTAPAASGIVGWVQSQGGPAAAVMFIVFATFTMLSALRQVLYKYDGIAPGADIPPADKALTGVNKACIILGNVLDFITGNTKH